MGKELKMERIFWEAVEENPIIAAVKNMEDLEKCCSLSDIHVVFILFGDICSIADIVQKVKEAGKIAMIHVDLIGGLSTREIAVEFLKNNTEADGIITTKPALSERPENFLCIRYFVISFWVRWHTRIFFHSSTVYILISLKFFQVQCQKSYIDCVLKSKCL